MAELTIHFDVRLSQKLFRYLLAGLVVFVSVGDVGSESVTLNTYYPAPSGVYQYMVTTNTTFLARDFNNVNIGYTSNQTGKLNVNGSVNVGLASGVSPLSKMDVNGNLAVGTYAGTAAAPANGLAVSGNVGIGTSGPSSKLQVNGTGGGTVDFIVNGRMQTGDGSASGGIWLSNAANMFVGQNGTNVGFYTATGGWSLMQNQAGYVEIGSGNTGPLATLDVGPIGQNTGVIIARQTSCFEQTYSLGTTLCPVDSAGRVTYATMQSGIMSQYAALGNLNGIDTATGSQVYVYNGSMLCCTQMSGGMPAGW